jgi:hypothetical protein
MSDTDRQLGRAEQELRQAIAALQECRGALADLLASGQLYGKFSRPAESAKIAADHVLALYAKRSIGTECAAVAKDVLLAGLGVNRG